MGISKLKHPAWVGVVLPIVLAVGATFSPEVLRGVLLVGAVASATWTFHKTELASRKFQRTGLAFLVFLALGIGTFFVGLSLDARNKMHDRTIASSQASTEKGPEATDDSANDATRQSEPDAKTHMARNANAYHRSKSPQPTTVTNIAPGGIANSGTIGQATVINNGPLSRVLNVDQQNYLRDALTPIKLKAIVWFFGSDGDTQKLALSVYNALKDAGWEMNDPAPMASIQTQVFDTDVAVFTPGTRGIDPPSPGAVEVVNALKSSRMPQMKIESGWSENIQSGYVKVVIGPRWEEGH